MGIFKKENPEEFYETDDRLVVYDADRRICNMYYITHIDDESVMAAGKVKVPKDDCQVANSEEGLVYLYNAPTEIIKETERLARLEESIVLRQITQYEEPEVPNPNMDLFKWALVVLLIVAIIF